MRFSIGVPRVTVQRQMNVAALLRARTAHEKRPSWTAIFLKGYALLARETPELRRACQVALATALRISGKRGLDRP
jgi:hypothetical protein